MPAIRAVVWEWAARGEVQVLQKGRVISEAQGEKVKGPIRVRLRREGAEEEEEEEQEAAGVGGSQKERRGKGKGRGNIAEKPLVLENCG